MANKLYVANAIIKKKFKNDEEEAEKASFLCSYRKNGKRNFFSSIINKIDSNFITGKFETMAQI